MKENHHEVKHLVILSGKGGTGKTSVTAGLIHIASNFMQIVSVDADVDAANLALAVGSEALESHSFTGGKIAIIDPDLCSRCGLCFDVCRYDAIQLPEKPGINYKVIDLLCDGCGGCVQVCPEKAIHMEAQVAGEWFHSFSEYGHLFHAELYPAAENSGKLVTTVKQHAKLFAQDHKIKLVIVDGPPGIGCPVISASSGADLALIITEPGVTGIHDLKRIVQTLAHFEIPIMIAVNKANIFPEGTQDIRHLARDYGYQIAVELPFDQDVPKAMIKAIPITKFRPESPTTKAVKTLWEQIRMRLFESD